MCSIRPLSDRIAVLPNKVEEKLTKSGIIITVDSQDEPMEGTVVAVGKGTDNNPIIIKVGDKVLFDKRTGTPVTKDGDTCLIMRQAELLAKL